jgi:hypothetical protein
MERARGFVEHIALSQNAWSLLIDCETDLPFEYISDDEARMPVFGRPPTGRITDFYQRGFHPGDWTGERLLPDLPNALASRLRAGLSPGQTDCRQNRVPQ